jgi:hypothetical protein
MILLPRIKHVQTGLLRCENLACPERGTPHLGVVCEPDRQGVPTTRLRWEDDDCRECQRTVVLCCRCREEAEQGTQVRVTR